MYQVYYSLAVAKKHLNKYQPILHDTDCDRNVWGTHLRTQERQLEEILYDIVCVL